MNVKIYFKLNAYIVLGREKMDFNILLKICFLSPPISFSDTTLYQLFSRKPGNHPCLLYNSIPIHKQILLTYHDSVHFEILV